MTEQDGPFLKPIEEPEDPVMKQIYHATAKEWGKVITPVKVHSARLPTAFIQFYGKIGELDNNLELSGEIAFLIRQRVATLNGCAFTIDSTRAYSIKQSMNQAKFDAIREYATSPLFGDTERAALDFASELTNTKRVTRDTFDRLRARYSARQICEIAYLVASEHLFDVTDSALNIQSDNLSDIARKEARSRTSTSH